MCASLCLIPENYLHFNLLLQVWDWDFEKQAQVLILDADYMVLVNDPVLIELVQKLNSSGGLSMGSGRRSIGSGKEEKGNFLRNLAELGGTVLLKIIEVGIEILAS